MNSDEAFRSFCDAIETDPLDVLLAKWRRDAFTARLRKLPGVVQIIHSGSLARGTYVGGIHDVDLIVVFDQADHPDWGRERGSAPAALGHLAQGIDDRLGRGQSPLRRLAYGTQLRNHVVRCRDVSVGPLDGLIPSGPPVDVMPTLRVGSHLRVPHRGKNVWEDTDPERLIRLVAERKREWKYFGEAVRMVKHWASHHHLRMNSLAVEVMVLKYCPRPRFFETLSCGEAMARFFDAASKANIRKLIDPMGRCGEIDPGMDYGALRSALKEAAALSQQAMAAEQAMEVPLLDDGSLKHPSYYWRKVFGMKYPLSQKRFWHPQHAEPFWLTTRTADGGERLGHRDGRHDGGESPRRPPAAPRGSDTPGPPDSGPDGGGTAGPRPGRRGGGPRRPGPRYGPSFPHPAEPGPDRWEAYFQQGSTATAPAFTFG